MSSGVAADAARQDLRLGGFEETQLERQGLTLDTGAPVTAAVSTGTGVAAAFGDGVVRFFRPDEPPLIVEAHRGAVLCLVAEGTSGAVLTGGDDGRFLRVTADGTVEEIASFGTRWVDCVAAGPGHYACSSGRTAHVWHAGRPTARTFDHPSTVGGLAFDGKARRLAVAHYGGATVWERGERRWKSSKFVWKGSHGAATFSPDRKYLVTLMQENALHGWRLRDKADMRMSGYPAKVKSFTWIGSAPHLATSGADQAICWPFEGKDGPMGRPPDTCAYGGKQLCTAVTGLLGHDGVLAGFTDGCVLAGRVSPDGASEDLVVKGSSGTPVAALALTPEGWLFVGEEGGRVLWVRLGGKPA
ncbi:WD40 repeat domain-containing protein [Pontivivens ytuae]|uniref:WD40 repeat domain-containing protein n=1 Tax=Pontivivens ytuae TaxID=2789856 RepID=A0A7S9QBM1_9RHOB|nr:WD40 repeat domain-containing protein [Pontivivens ytuae]QPH53313.1 WD40 repeat domain-containing protein [Pontivivens ytuae]